MKWVQNSVLEWEKKIYCDFRSGLKDENGNSKERPYVCGLEHMVIVLRHLQWLTVVPEIETIAHTEPVTDKNVDAIEWIVFRLLCTR